MEKKIAFFVGELFMDFQTKVYSGIRRAMGENDVRVDVFSNLGIFSGRGKSSESERKFINIPDLSDYDGIIVAPDTYTLMGMKDAFIEKIKSDCKCPVISIRAEVDGFYNVLTDDHDAIESITDHFIMVHNCKRIAYLSGKKEFKDAQERLRGFMDSMKKHGIEVTDKMIFHGDYWSAMTKEAIDWFLSDGMPEVIICANDYMAISVVDELRDRGIKVPEQIKVSGFDDIEESRVLEPRLSTAKAPAEEMGYRALSNLCKLIDGEEVPVNTFLSVPAIFEGTCGCKVRKTGNIAKETFIRLQKIRLNIYRELTSVTEYGICENINDIFNASYVHSKGFDYKKIFVCLCNGEPNDFYSDEMKLAAIMSPEGLNLDCEETFKRTEILPAQYRDESNLLCVFTLHFNGKCFGYIAMEVDDAESLTEGFMLWSFGLSSNLARFLD